MGITYGNLPLFHGNSELSVYNKISTREYNNRKFYDCLNNPLLDDCGIPDLNIPPISIDDIPRLHKRSRYTPVLIPSAISVASENSVSNLTNPYD